MLSLECRLAPAGFISILLILIKMQRKLTMKRILRCVATVMGVLLCLFVFQPATSGDLAYPGTLPDAAILEMTDTGATLKNNLLETV